MLFIWVYSNNPNKNLQTVAIIIMNMLYHIPIFYNIQVQSTKLAMIKIRKIY